ncbi:MAG: type II secretion system protein N [Burkholderiales bacterium]
MRKPVLMETLFFVITLVLVAVMNVPASWVAQRVAQATGQKVLLTNSTGTLWRGSAELVLWGGPDALGIFPGRVHWHLVPHLKGLEFILEAPDSGAMAGTISGTLGWSSGHLAPGVLMLPAQVLTGWGAPFNTLHLEGLLRWRWEALDWHYREAAPRTLVSLTVEADQVRSRLSSVAPLGQYRLRLAWGPLGGKLDLETLTGPLMLSGQGSIVNGRLGFDGQATASDALEPQLIGLLSILGKREGAITRLHY